VNNRDDARTLAASLAEMDSRLVRVIRMAIAEKPPFGYTADQCAENIARAVWAWLAEGDE
jgi:hypothetical protein